MPAKKITTYTTVAAAKGLRVHAVSLTSATLTMCGRRFSGWNVVPKRLNCGKCKLAILKATMEQRR